MARHRNVRNRSYSDDYDDEYSLYGRSLDDDVAVSPSTAEQFLFHRDTREDPSLGSFMEDKGGEGGGGGGMKKEIQRSPLTTNVASAATGGGGGGGGVGGGVEETDNGRYGVRAVGPPPGFPAKPQWKLQSAVGATGDFTANVDRTHTSTQHLTSVGTHNSRRGFGPGLSGLVAMQSGSRDKCDQSLSSEQQQGSVSPLKPLSLSDLVSAHSRGRMDSATGVVPGGQSPSLRGPSLGETSLLDVDGRETLVEKRASLSELLLRESSAKPQKSSLSDIIRDRLPQSQKSSLSAMIDTHTQTWPAVSSSSSLSQRQTGGLGRPPPETNTNSLVSSLQPLSISRQSQTTPTLSMLIKDQRSARPQTSGSGVPVFSFGVSSESGASRTSRASNCPSLSDLVKIHRSGAPQTSEGHGRTSTLQLSVSSKKTPPSVGRDSSLSARSTGPSLASLAQSHLTTPPLSSADQSTHPSSSSSTAAVPLSSLTRTLSQSPSSSLTLADLGSDKHGSSPTHKGEGPSTSPTHKGEGPSISPSYKGEESPTHSLRQPTLAELAASLNVHCLGPQPQDTSTVDDRERSSEEAGVVCLLDSVCEPRMFALAMCRPLVGVGVGGRRRWRGERVRRKVLRTLARDFVTRQTARFSFSTPSPDDIVKAKQEHGLGHRGRK